MHACTRLPFLLFCHCTFLPLHFYLPQNLLHGVTDNRERETNKQQAWQQAVAAIPQQCCSGWSVPSSFSLLGDYLPHACTPQKHPSPPSLPCCHRTRTHGALFAHQLSSSSIHPPSSSDSDSTDKPSHCSACFWCVCGVWCGLVWFSPPTTHLPTLWKSRALKRTFMRDILEKAGKGKPPQAGDLEGPKFGMLEAGWAGMGRQGGMRGRF